MIKRQVALGLMLLLSSAAVSKTATAAKVDWLSDVDQGWQATQTTDRPMLLFVTKSSCKYCIKMKRNTYADADVASQINEAFVPVMIDSDVANRVLKNIKIHAYPTTLLISPEAVLLDKIKGYVSPQKLARRLSAAQQKQEDTTQQ